MGQSDNYANEPSGESRAEQTLSQVAQDLQTLQQTLIAQLGQDVNRLQAEKSRLLNDIERLQDQRQMLESQESALLSQRQLAQQQVWAKQLAQALAVHLHAALMQRLSQSVEPYAPQANLPSATGSVPPEMAYRMLASLDSTVSRTLSTLRQDLTSYQSNLTQQLNRMQTLEQQGEALLEALVNRLSQQLQTEMAQTPPQPLTTPPPAPPVPPEPAAPLAQNVAPNDTPPLRRPAPTPDEFPLPPRPVNPVRSPQSASNPWVKLVGGIGVAAVVLLFLYLGMAIWRAIAAALPPSPINLGSVFLLLLLFGAAGFFYNRLVKSTPAKRPVSVSPTAPAIAPPVLAVPPPRTPAPPRTRAQFQLGLALVLLSTLALSLHNVVVSILGYESNLFGRVPVGGFLNLNLLGNAMLILWMRMLIVLPLMIGVAKVLYPVAWSDIRTVLSSNERSTRSMLRTVIGSGLFMFLWQVLLYLAIGQLGPSVAVTISFIYPVVTLPLAWLLFKERITLPRVAVLALIVAGAFFVALPKLGLPLTATSNTPLGVTAAIFSGVAFAFYLISMQISFGRRLHPVPVSLLQFTTMFVLASLSLIFLPLGVDVQPGELGGLLFGGVLLGVLTLLSNFLNDIGSRSAGAVLGFIITSTSVPALTALTAFVLIPGDRTALTLIQIFGILLVTLGLGALSVEKAFSFRQVPKSAPQKV